MVMRKIVLCIIFLEAFLAGRAQDGELRTRIEGGVRSVKQLWLEREYQEAFTRCFELERVIEHYETENKVRLPELHYKTVKQIFTMYLNSSKAGNPKCSEFFAEMRQIADELQDEDTTLDVLRSASLYYQKFGGQTEADRFYRNWVTKKMEGKDSSMIENVYRTTLELAEKNDITSLAKALKEYHKHVQDSLRKVRESEMIRGQESKRKEETQVLEEAGERMDFVKNLTIVVLAILALAGGVLAYVFSKKYRALASANKRSGNEWKEYMERNALRDDCLCNVCGWAESALDRLERKFSIDLVSPDLAEDIRSLQPLMKNIREYMMLDANRENMYERSMQNILPICQMAVDDARPFLQVGVDFEMSIPNQSLPVYEDGLRRVLSHLLINAALNTSMGKILIGFKRRSPKVCQIVVTDTGCGVPKEKRSGLFSPFSRLDKLREADYKGLAVCSVIAHRMSAELKYDSDYTHGARFVLEFHG